MRGPTRKDYAKVFPWLHRTFDPYMPARLTAKRQKARGTGYYGRFQRQAGNRTEWKFHDVTFDDASISTVGDRLTSANLIAQGVTESDRLGRKCTIRSIEWRYTITKTTEVASDADSVVRVIMYVDKQANGAAAEVLDLLKTADFQSFYNLANRNRFRILMDKTYDLNAMAGGGNGTILDTYTRALSRRFYKKCSIPIEYKLTTAVIGAVTSNNIMVLLISNRAKAKFDSEIRLRFTG